MTNRKRFLLSVLLSILSIASCTTTAPPPPEPVSEASRRLIDPVIGFETTDTASIQASAAAWRAFQAGRISEAERQWQQILLDQPDFAPAKVGLSSVAMVRNQFRRAEELLQGVDLYPASRVLEAELLIERGQIVEAAEMLRPFISLPGTPSKLIFRYEALAQRAVAQLSADAAAEQSEEVRIEILKRALELAPEHHDLRLRLVEDLIALELFDQARARLQPIIEHDAGLNRVQGALAEIEIGEGKYQSAMRRYERLVERTGDSVYREKLESSKRLWHESTLPQQFQLAVRSPNVTREQLAVLLFWKLPSIRFAQNLPQPPIVVDIDEAMGREELVRILSVGLLPVDRATRSIRPRRTVTASQFLTTAAAAMRYVSSDPCVGSTGSPAQRLQACGIDARGLESNPDGFVTGATAAAILDQIAALDRSAE